jgi:DNA-binding NarL/FixJ family response regulator
LILDEWPMLRAGVAKVLSDAGGRVVAEVGDAVAAYAALRTHRPDLLVLGDHDSSSVDVVRRALEMTPEVRCVALLVTPGPDDLRDLLGAGAHAALPRTVDPAELIDTVRRVLAGERVVSPAVLHGMFNGGGAVPAPAPAVEAAVPAAPGPSPVTRSGRKTMVGLTSALTAKEHEVLRLMAAGRSNAEIADVLFVSGATVKTHLAHIYGKLGVSGRYEALTRAVALGLLG